MRKFNQLRRLVLALSGADEEILGYVPSERTRFESLGWAILITSCMAMISMWFALSSALGINGILAIPVAVFWGLVIMGIDRWLITSMPLEGNRKFAMAVPRVLLAILLGTLISTPLVLRIFQSEINAQMAVMQQKSYSSFLSNQQSSQVNQQVTTYDNELQQLETVINSKGAQTGNTAADPELLAYNNQLTQLQTELSHWTTLKNQYYTAYICQLYGGAQCPKKGDGPAGEGQLHELPAGVTGSDQLPGADQPGPVGDSAARPVPQLDEQVQPAAAVSARRRTNCRSCRVSTTRRYSAGTSSRPPSTRRTRPRTAS